MVVAICGRAGAGGIAVCRGVGVGVAVFSWVYVWASVWVCGCPGARAYGCVGVCVFLFEH